MDDIKLDIRKVSTEAEKMICANIMASTEPWITLGINYDKLMNTINDSLNEVFVAYVQKEIIGTIIIQTKGAFSGYLKSIAIKTNWQDKHLGKIMMKFLEEEIFSEHTNVFLCVSSFNLAAKRFYLKLGYEVIGEIKNYLVKGQDEILMRKTIGPILENAG
ncbi:MAG: N-acetyltransferase [Bacteroidota bacterium]